MQSVKTDVPAATRRRRGWRYFLFLFTIQVLIGIAIFEVVVRVCNIDYNISSEWKYHAVLGWSQVPLSSYQCEVNGRTVRISFNSRGFRDEEHPTAKPPGTKRIVVIGDSFCEALQVNLEETFYERVAAALSRDGERWEAINLGVGDFGTAQEWLALENYAWQFQPDLVLHQIFPLNDLANNALAFAGLCKSANDRYRPYFVPENGELRQTSWQPVRTFLRRHSAAYGLVEHAVLKILKSMTPKLPPEEEEKVWRGRWAAAGYGEVGPMLGGYREREHQHPDVARAWDLMDMLVERIARRCRQHGVPLVPVVVPFEACVGPGLEQFWAAMPKSPPSVPDYPERHFARLFEKLALPGVLLKPSFDENAEAVLPYIDGHLSSEGHRVAAEVIVAKLRALGIAK